MYDFLIAVSARYLTFLEQFLARVLEIYFDDAPGKAPALNYRPLQTLFEKKEAEVRPPPLSSALQPRALILI